jgi:hypothetical protein
MNVGDSNNGMPTALSHYQHQYRQQRAETEKIEIAADRDRQTRSSDLRDMQDMTPGEYQRVLQSRREYRESESKPMFRPSSPPHRYMSPTSASGREHNNNTHKHKSNNSTSPRGGSATAYMQLERMNTQLRGNLTPTRRITSPTFNESGRSTGNRSSLSLSTAALEYRQSSPLRSRNDDLRISMSSLLGSSDGHRHADARALHHSAGSYTGPGFDSLDGHRQNDARMISQNINPLSISTSSYTGGLYRSRSTSPADTTQNQANTRAYMNKSPVMHHEYLSGGNNINNSVNLTPVVPPSNVTQTQTQKSNSKIQNVGGGSTPGSSGGNAGVMAKGPKMVGVGLGLAEETAVSVCLFVGLLVHV